jgi:hypothetical protein
MEDLNELLGRVAEPDTPEDRDGAWDEIVRRFGELERRVSLAELAAPRLRPSSLAADRKKHREAV